jgi:DNA polymerase-1
MKTKYQNILDNINEDVPTQRRDKFQKVLLIDGLNLFYRNFCVINSINSNNEHIGGSGGFLRSLALLIRNNRPTKVFVVFDGGGHTNNRKNILSEYKSNRVQRKILNKNIHSSFDEDENSQIKQLGKINEYLKLLPVHTVMVDGFEADDIIAIMARTLDLQYNTQSLIVSSDQDFLQLINRNITVYRPMEKKYYRPEDVINKFDCTPQNFILYKILMGDTSDNIKKIKGLGAKKFKTLFPQLKEKDTVTFDDLIDYAGDNIDEHEIFARIVVNEDDLKKSYLVMDLEELLVNDKEVSYIKTLIESKTPTLNRVSFKKQYDKDLIEKLIPNLDKWLEESFGYFYNINK